MSSFKHGPDAASKSAVLKEEAKARRRKKRAKKKSCLCREESYAD